VNVGAHAVGGEAQGGDVVAALPEDDGKGAVHAVEVPATVGVNVAHYANNFALLIKADLAERKDVLFILKNSKFSVSEHQGCGSGWDSDSVTLWIRIRFGNPDPDPGARK
jgi:hypothetical protein